MTRRCWLVLATAIVLGCGSRAPAPVAPRTASPTQAEEAESWRAQVPTPGRARVPSYPIPEHIALDNGMQALVVAQPIHVVAILAVVRHGASAVPAGQSGLAALTARMLTEGTLRRSSEQLAVATENLGSELVADAGRDYSSVGMTVLPDDLDAAVRLLAEVLREPAFVPSEFERVRAEWVDGLLAERQSPDRLATLAGLRLLLGPIHGSPVGGSVPDVQRLSVGDLRTFYEQHYSPGELALVVVGDVTATEVQATVEQHLGDWQPTSVAAPLSSPLEPPLERRKIVVVDRPGSAQSALCVVEALPPRGAPGEEAREVMNTVLGGMFTSRLNQNLREQHGYTYGAGSVAIATRTWGAFVAMTSVEAPATGAAIEEIVGELGALGDPRGRRPLGEDELERAKTALVHAQSARLERASDIAEDVAELFTHELPWDYFATYASRVQRVTREEVVEQAQRYLHPERLGIVAVGPRDAIEQNLRSSKQTVETAHPSLLE